MSEEHASDSEIHEDESKHSNTTTENEVPVSENTLKDLVNVSCLLQDEIPNMRQRIEWLELSCMAMVLLICMQCIATLTSF